MADAGKSLEEIVEAVKKATDPSAMGELLGLIHSS